MITLLAPQSSIFSLAYMLFQHHRSEQCESIVVTRVVLPLDPEDSCSHRTLHKIGLTLPDLKLAFLIFDVFFFCFERTHTQTHRHTGIGHTWANVSALFCFFF